MFTKILSIFDEKTQKNILSYLEGNYDQDVKDKIISLIKTAPEEIRNSFYTKISFGTGGIRGKMGIGTNRLNEYTIRAATQGLASYLIKENTNKEISVFIGYDNRHNSRFFAEQTAGVLAENNIKSFIFKTLCPTPIVSFGCRHKKCSAAVMITASHNPPEYNGYKVYWNDGGQVVPPNDQGIIDQVNLITDPSSIRVAPISHHLIESIEEEIFTTYLEEIEEIENNKNENETKGKELSIVYTSLHGAGITILPRALKSWGFENISLVENQCVPDESFTFAKKPNPEEKQALDQGILLLLEKNADMLIATDPDADRMAVVINHHNKPIILTGNQTASILLQHILQSLENENKLEENSATVKSIVTTELFSEISKNYNCKCFDVLTGFKYISEKIKLWEEDNSYKFIFGAEESIGFLRGDFVRDKDAISSSCLIAEAALQAKLNNKTLFDILVEIYQKYGVYRESLTSLVFPDGVEGMNKMKNLMHSLRTAPPKQLADFIVTSIEDYKKSISHDLQTDKTSSINLPVSDVLVFKLSDNSKIVIRPSGTEPKIKIYIGAFEKNGDDVEKEMQACDKKIENLIKALQETLNI